ncbi:hypothetical protein [Sphingomonas sp.]|nr:hypothetical protein [Sphingomonas sp.]
MRRALRLLEYVVLAAAIAAQLALGAGYALAWLLTAVRGNL